MQNENTKAKKGNVSPNNLGDTSIGAYSFNNRNRVVYGMVSTMEIRKLGGL